MLRETLRKQRDDDNGSGEQNRDLYGDALEFVLNARQRAGRSDQDGPCFGMEALSLFGLRDYGEEDVAKCFIRACFVARSRRVTEESNVFEIPRIRLCELQSRARAIDELAWGLPDFVSQTCALRGAAVLVTVLAFDFGQTDPRGVVRVGLVDIGSFLPLDPLSEAEDAGA
jgi:hypothetical protein